ncbi:MAG: patatin-like phospholipase family protein [Candidatus Marinimicrobia bacterium]|nr:patatin-like phospholipase family protein [Candidatus Neomarinimicrobiota bacterium]
MKKDVALVLSSGGARGFAHAGVIRALERYGFTITSVAGSSMGSLIGGLYATGELPKLLDYVEDLDVLDVLKLTDFTVSSKGLVKGDKVIKKLKALIPDRNIEELEIPYCAIATDIESGEEKIFDSGKLYDAIRASISIPTVFQPAEIGGHFYVDGGVLNPIPINRVKRRRRDIVVAVNVAAMSERGAGAPEREEKEEDATFSEQIRTLYEKIGNLIPRNRTDSIGFFNLVNKTINLMLNQISELTLAQDPPDILINIPEDAFGVFDFYKAKEIIENGEAVAEKAIRAYLKK